MIIAPKETEDDKFSNSDDKNEDDNDLRNALNPENRYQKGGEEETSTVRRSLQIMSIKPTTERSKVEDAIKEDDEKFTAPSRKPKRVLDRPSLDNVRIKPTSDNNRKQFVKYSDEANPKSGKTHLFVFPYCINSKQI